MPTSRPRHVITETDRVAEALDAAAQRWPADSASRAQLLVRLVEAGHRALIAEADGHRDERERAIRQTEGVLAGAYGRGYLSELREDWPA